MGCPHPLSPHSLCCTHRQDAQRPDQPRVGEEGTAAQLEQWATPAGMDGGGGLSHCSASHSPRWGHPAHLYTVAVGVITSSSIRCSWKLLCCGERGR